MSSVPGLPDIAMTLEPSTSAVICKISRNTGNPAGPLPTIFIGKSIRTILPLPAIVVKLGAVINTQLGTSFVGSFTTRKPVTAVSVALRSSSASLNRSVYGAGTTPPQVGQYLTTVLRSVSLTVAVLYPCCQTTQTRFLDCLDYATTPRNT